MNLVVLILTSLAGLAVLAAVVLVAMGRAGELASYETDHRPLELPTDRPITSGDLSGIHLPLALWGYHVRAVDQALHRAAASLAERDTRIAELQRRVTELSDAAWPGRPGAPERQVSNGWRTQADPGGPGAAATADTAVSEGETAFNRFEPTGGARRAGAARYDHPQDT